MTSFSERSSFRFSPSSPPTSVLNQKCFAIQTLQIVSLFSRDVFHHRNRNDPQTSTSSARPDVIIKYDRFVVLRGEEKSSENRIEQADKEIVGKMRQWSRILYGDMPYIFAYTTRAEHARLHFINPSRQSSAIGDYDLKNQEQRFAFTEAVIRIALLMPRLIETVPDVLRTALVFVEQTLSRQEGQCSLRFSDASVQKTWTELPTDATAAAYKELAKLSSGRNRPRGLIAAKMIKNTNERCALAVRMTPLGFVLTSWTEITPEQLLMGIGDVVTGLNTWHSQGFCHGDVRPTNIVCLELNLSEWALIDFDLSHRADDKITIHWHHPCSGQILGYGSDWKQVAELIGVHPKCQGLKKALQEHTQAVFDGARVKFDES
eukprot:c13163_g2_i3.p1 GENE.c13163_g2_i3~~c13163_g2_i3.p1  ORF type:complete len:376 (-),score=55.50 c13163_g2_i3:115-1242(-)